MQHQHGETGKRRELLGQAVETIVLEVQFAETAKFANVGRQRCERVAVEVQALERRQALEAAAAVAARTVQITELVSAEIDDAKGTQLNVVVVLQCRQTAP